MATVKETTQKISPISILVVSTNLLVLTSIGILTIVSLNHANVNCKVIMGKSQSLFVEKKYQEAYDQLVPYQKKCGAPISKDENTNSKIQKLTFHGNLAVAAYALGEKEFATSEAEKGLAIMKSLSNSDKQRASTSVITDMALVKDGLY